MKPIKNAGVARAFAAYPPRLGRKLMALRELIFRTATSTDGVGTIKETLKWGDPAYVTSQTRSGSTIRLGWKKSNPTRYAMYFHCQTNLIASFRTRFPNELTFEGNLSIVFSENDVPPIESLSFCVAAALTYHRTKNASRRMARP